MNGCRLTDNDNRDSFQFSVVSICYEMGKIQVVFLTSDLHTMHVQHVYPCILINFPVLTKITYFEFLTYQ